MNKGTLKLNVLISTIDGGIENIKNVILSPREDVHYIVSHQFREEKFNFTPPELLREDITVSHIPGFGVTKSRNYSIGLATGDIGFFSDDDVKYEHSDFDAILKSFKENEFLDVALFKIRTPKGSPEYKNYPAEAQKLNRLLFSVGTIEISFRVQKIVKSSILFDERFGAGNSFLIGSDENIFILDCLKQGLNVWFFPTYVVQHPFESTVKKLPKYDKQRVRVAGGFDCRINGSVSILKAFLGTLKLLPDLIKEKENPIKYLYHRLSGVLYILRTTHR